MAKAQARWARGLVKARLMPQDGKGAPQGPQEAIMVGPVTIGVVAVAALLLVGPKKLPELARGMAEAMGEFRKGTQGILEQDKAGEAKDGTKA